MSENRTVVVDQSEVAKAQGARLHVVPPVRAALQPARPSTITPPDGFSGPATSLIVLDASRFSIQELSIDPEIAASLKQLPSLQPYRDCLRKKQWTLDKWPDTSPLDKTIINNVRDAYFTVVFYEFSMNPGADAIVVTVRTSLPPSFAHCLTNTCSRVGTTKNGTV